MMILGFALYSLFFIPYSTSAQNVDLLWQADTYTPPFYQGKASWSAQSTIKLIAIPNGLGNPNSLNYQWIRNGTVLGRISGIGQNTINYTDSVISRPQKFEVEIVAGDERVLASASVTLSPSTPSLLVYERNPLYGYIFQKEIGAGFQMADQEVSLSAFPMFISPAVRDMPNFSYRWRSNAGEAENSNSVTYRVPEGGSGSARVNLRLTNNLLIMNDLTRDFLIQFGE
jgi:hypothetical protein